MAPAGFEPTISAGERPQTYALDRAATGRWPYINDRNLREIPYRYRRWSCRYRIVLQ